MKTPDKKYFENPEKYIPEGMYCYTITSIDSKTGRIKTDTCPFWDHNDKYLLEQNYGYCHYLKQGDWERNKKINDESIITSEIDKGKTVSEVIGEDFPSSLLWDQCKECDINDNWDKEDPALDNN